jgi:hypothetical protein
MFLSSFAQSKNRTQKSIGVCAAYDTTAKFRFDVAALNTAQRCQKFPLNQLFMRSRMSLKLLPDSFGASRPRASSPAINSPMHVA